MENARVANILDQIGDLLELKEANQFKVRSYQNAARSIRNLPERLDEMIDQGKKPSEIPNVGKSIAGKINEIMESGTCKRLEELKKSEPGELIKLMEIPGLGARKVMQIHKKLNVKSVHGLERACREHKVRELEGMGAKTEEKILKGIKTVQRTEGRILYSEAAEYFDSLTGYLDKIDELNKWEVAGSFRRGKETIGDLDILLNAGDRRKATDVVLDYSEIVEVISRGDEKVSVKLAGGLQVDFRFFDDSGFGAASMYFTGSKSHNIKLRKRAQRHKWKLNEYGLFKSDNLLAGRTEEAVYRKLDLPWIAPELREDRGEIESAEKGSLPELVTNDDIRGDFQSHTTASDGKNSILEMGKAAQRYGFDYLAITDHSKRVSMANGLNDDEVREHAEKIREVDSGMKRFWLMAGIEVDILKNGKLDLSEKTLSELDWVVASVHYDRNMSRDDMTKRIINALETKLVHCLGHPLGRIIGKRDPVAVDMDKVIEACIDNDVLIEINAQPDRLDLPYNYCKSASGAGARFVISTDSHSKDGFSFMPFGVNVARRGWLTGKDILNTRSITQLRKELSG